MNISFTRRFRDKYFATVKQHKNTSLLKRLGKFGD